MNETSLMEKGVGSAGLVLAPSVNWGKEFKTMRESVVERNILRYSIELQGGLFAGTGACSVIWGLDTNDIERPTADEMLMIDITPFSQMAAFKSTIEKRRGKPSILKESELKHALGAIRDFQDPDWTPNGCECTSTHSCFEQTCKYKASVIATCRLSMDNFNPRVYLPYRPAEQIDVAKHYAELKVLEKKAEAARSHLEETMTYLGYWPGGGPVDPGDLDCNDIDTIKMHLAAVRAGECEPSGYELGCNRDCLEKHPDIEQEHEEYLKML